jgi:hypothetical protein
VPDQNRYTQKPSLLYKFIFNTGFPKGTISGRLVKRNLNFDRRALD